MIYWEYRDTCGHFLDLLHDAEVVCYVSGENVMLDKVQDLLVSGVWDLLKDLAALGVEDADCLGKMVSLHSRRR